MRRLLVVFLLSAAGIAAAQGYPDRPIRMIVPYPPGGGTDIAARWVSQKLGEALRQTIVVENRAGANGNIGTDAIAKAAPDGYTIGMATPGPVTIGRSLYPALPYDPLRDLAPIILANDSPVVLAAHPGLPARSMAELVDLARRAPGKHTAALTATGSVAHLLTALMKRSAAIDVLEIPYKGGGPAATDVMAGQVDMLFAVLPAVLPMINAGKMRPIAVAANARSELLPDTPTMREAGYPDLVGGAWNGVVAPAGTPPDIVARLNAEIAKLLATNETRERFKTLAMEPGGGTPQRFAAFLREESQKWGAIVRAANIRPE